MGYATAMVYVHTTDGESRRRNEQRLVSGAKTISEDVRSRKWNAAQVYMRTYSRTFDPFYLFDNSADLKTVSEEKKQEMLNWLVELGEGISRFLSGKDLNKLFENISSTAVDNSVGMTNSEASNSPTENDATIIQKGAPRRKIQIRRPYTGTAMADKNSSFGNAPSFGTVGESVQNDYASSESPTSAQTKVPQVASKKKPKNRGASLPPPDFGDARLGTVPSGGIGLVSNSYQPKAKTISELRRNINSYRDNPDRE
jgi:hypothetical protein